MNNIKAHGLKIVLDINEALKNIKAGQWHQAG
jgi:diacylglycerol kinase family enzyme